MSQDKPGTPDVPENGPEQPEDTTPVAPEESGAPQTDAPSAPGADDTADTEDAAQDTVTDVPATTSPAPGLVAPEVPSAATPAPTTQSGEMPTGVGATDSYALSGGPDLAAYPVLAQTRRSEGASLGARLGAEAFGTFVLVLAGLGTALYAQYTGAATLGVALAFGLAAGATHLAIARVSGGHLNPAITLGSALAGRTRFAHLLPYWVAQLIGGALAAAVLYLPVSTFPALETIERQFFGSTANGFGAHSPLAVATGSAEGFSMLAALLVEVVVSAILVGVFLAITGRTGSDRTGVQRSAAGYGAALAVAVLIAAPITNAGLNPARSVAAAIFAESWAWGQIWVFAVGPLVGAMLAALLYRGFSGGDDEELDDELADDVLIEEETVVVEGR
ncbi:aquaporin [Cellulomonas sp. NPDC089187]|uniref:MIP/aquaporin family protein n=1 Tax=Cellulomonas sp. NPDC089187 TaxID=3154970 RepID=UPI00341B5FB7